MCAKQGHLYSSGVDDAMPKATCGDVGQGYSSSSLIIITGAGIFTMSHFPASSHLPAASSATIRHCHSLCTLTAIGGLAYTHSSRIPLASVAGMADGQEGFYSSTSGTYFADEAALKEHYQSDLHRYNLKRKVAGLPPVTKEWFDARKEQLTLTGGTAQVHKVRYCAFMQHGRGGGGAQAKPQLPSGQGIAVRAGAAASVRIWCLFCSTCAALALEHLVAAVLVRAASLPITRMPCTGHACAAAKACGATSRASVMCGQCASKQMHTPDGCKKSHL